MTQVETGGSTSGGRESKVQAAREQTSTVGQSAAQAGGKVAQTVAGQGREVAAESGRQARNLLDEASSQLKEQADAQQKRAAHSLRALGDELQSMSTREAEQGPATDLVRRASGTVRQAADWLEQREPGTVVNEVREFARRRPGVFLAGAALAGVLAGRLTRNLGGAGDGGPDGGAGTQPASGGPGAESAEQTGDSAQTGDAQDGESWQEPGAVPEGSSQDEVHR
jgi:hypothetical protein